MTGQPEVTTPTRDPVHGDALHSTDPSGDDVLPPGLIPFGAGYPVQPHVRPVHGVVSCKVGRQMMQQQQYLCSQTKHFVKTRFIAACSVAPDAARHYKAPQSRNSMLTY